MTPGCKVHTVVKLDVLETMTHNTQVLRTTIFFHRKRIFHQTLRCMTDVPFVFKNISKDI
jgi:hypothetical protein